MLVVKRDLKVHPASSYGLECRFPVLKECRFRTAVARRRKHVEIWEKRHSIRLYETNRLVYSTSPQVVPEPFAHFEHFLQKVLCYLVTGYGA